MSYPLMTDDYPAYDDFNKRYYNYDNYFHYNNNNERLRKQNMSPIILFNETRIKGSSAFANKQKPLRKEFLSKTQKNVKNRSNIKKGGLSSVSKMCSVKTMLKVVFILICCGVTFYQTIDIVNKYWSYPMDVNVIVEEMKLLQLPGITICNNNIILRESLFEEFEDLESQTNGSLKEIAKFTNSYMRNMSLNHIMSDLSLKKDDFIDEMECDSQFDPGVDKSIKEKTLCVNQEVIRSLQRNGVCFTHFHKMAKYKRKRDNSACRMMGTCVNKESVFDTNEIARFELNFRPQEYTSIDLPVSGRISIHDNTEIGDSLSNAYNLEPGYYYQFFIKIQSTSMLTKPYATNCLDYLEKNSKEFEEKPDYTSILLSRKQCSTLCTSKFTLRVCNCWPPELPYTEDNGLDANKTRYWCQWKFDMDSAAYAYGTCYDKDERMKCSVKCQPNCWTDHYEIAVQKLSFEYYGRKGWDSDNERLRKCCSVVSIRYWTTERTIHEYSPMFTLLDMVCYIGGLASMYTGLSLVAIYDYVTVIFFLTKKYV